MIFTRKFSYTNLPFKFNIYINGEFFERINICETKEIPLLPGEYDIGLEICGLYKHQKIKIFDKDNLILEFRVSTLLDIFAFLPLINFCIISFFITKKINYLTTLGILLPGIIYIILSTSKYAISTKITFKK